MPSRLDELLAAGEGGQTRGRSRLMELVPELREKEQPGVPPEAAAAISGMQRAGGKEAQQRMLLEGSLMGGGALLGGLAFGPGIVPQVVGEAAGTFAGGMLSGLPPEESLKAAAFSGTAGLAGRVVTHAGTRLAGKMAGIKPETVKAGIRDPRLLQKPTPEAELDLANRLQASTEGEAAKTTQYHSDYKNLLASKAAERIDATPILDSFTQRITGADHPILRAADRQVEGMASRLLKRIGPDGKIGVGELDAYIRENFTDPLKGAYTRGSEAETVRRLMEIRGDLTKQLYSAIGPGAAPAQAFTQRALTSREAVENVFSTGTPAKPSAAGAEAIRQIGANTGGAQRNRAILRAYDAEYGTDFLNMATRLSMQHEWAGDAIATAYAIDSVLQPSRPSFVRGLARPFARGGARVTVSSGPVSAAGETVRRVVSKKRDGDPEAAFQQEMERGRRLPNP